MPGLSVSYKVYINGEVLKDKVAIVATNYTYYPIELTNSTWNVGVRAYNESVMGNYSFTTVNISTGKILHAYCDYINNSLQLDYMVQISYDSHMTSKIRQGWQFSFTVNVSTCICGWNSG